MAISLKKGQKLSLVKELGLNRVQARLYWMINQFDTGGDADLDSSVFMLGVDGKVPSDNEFLYFNQKKHPSGVIINMVQRMLIHQQRQLISTLAKYRLISTRL